MNTQEAKLSLLLDDGLGSSEAAQLLKRMADDPELAAAWERYQVVQSVLRGQQPVVVDDNFAARVSRQIAAEMPPLAISPKRARHWLRPAVGLALAASVSALAVLSVREFGSNQEPLSLAEAGAGDGVNVQKATYGVLTQEQLDDYLKMHNDGVYFAGGGDLLPQARVAGYIKR